MTKKKAPATVPRRPTKKERDVAFDRKTAVDFPAVVLKGIIEHRDAGTYFGSTGGLDAWRAVTRKQGWILEGDVVTEAGRKHYAESGLEAFPKTPNRRAYFWDWSGYKTGDGVSTPSSD
jgi:hypothetical protein